MSSTRKFSIRAWVALVLVFTFAALAVSGVVLYFAPPCSVADATGWTILALTKGQWSAIHVITSIAFLVVALVHLLVYNLGPLKAYIKQKTPSRLPVRRELAVAVAVFAVLLGGAISGAPPFGTVMDWHDAIRDHYREQAPGRGEGRGEGRGGGQAQHGAPRDKTPAREAQAPDEAEAELLEPWITGHGLRHRAHGR